ncbi:MAG: L-2-amino-thiazoline-4-carboxylic acid hydrolase [Candidatus Hodarchaeales archaeon]|jgi:hypothetical protein
MFDIDQIFQYFIVLTSNQIKKTFNSEEGETILSTFSKRFSELFEKLKEKKNEIQTFHGINPVLVIALEESLPISEKDKKQVTEHVIAIYRMMLEDLVLEPQRRFMSSSENPWLTFIEDTRKGNKRTYENEYFKLQEVSATEEEFAFDINLCLYQEIFKEFGREDLGSIMCEYDSIIADNVSKWVRFERDETIAEGFPKCTFRFFRVKQKFSDNPVIDNIYSLLKIIDDSDEMLSKQEIFEKGFDEETDLEGIVKLIETINNHPGVKSVMTEEELLLGNVSSYKRHEEWKLLVNRKIPLEERNKIIRNLPLKLKEEKISQLITNIIENPYELASIKWGCLNYLQHHFSSRVGFETDGLDEFQLTVLLEEYTRNYPKMSFEAQSVDNTRVSIQVFGRGVPEYKLKEPAQLLRRKLVTDYPDASFSAIQPILSIDPVAKKFIDVLEDSKQPFQLRELALRILISRIGIKLVPYLKTISKNKKDDPFLRGRAIDSLAWFTSSLPKLEEFEDLPIPVQRSVVDFITRQGKNEELLVKVGKNEKITSVVRRIALKNLGTYTDPKVTDFLLDVIEDMTIDDLLRQAALEALGKHEVKSRINQPVLKIFTNTKESSFIRMEAFETLKELKFKEPLEIENPDWITVLGLKQLMEE